MTPGQKSFLEVSIILILCLAPVFYGSTLPWAVMILCAFLFFLASVFPQIFMNWTSFPSFMKKGLMILLAFLFIQLCFVSIYPYETAFQLTQWAAVGVAFCAVQSLEDKQIARLMYALIFVGIVISLYGFFQVVSGQEKVLWADKVLHHGYLTGTYWNRNHFAGLLELCLGVALGFVLKAMQKGEWTKVLLPGLAMSFLLFSLVKSGSRMGMASFFVSAFIFLFMLIKQKNVKLKPMVFFTLGILILCLWLGREGLMGRLHEVQQGLVSWDGERKWAWQDGLQILWALPFAGVGLGNFEWAFPQYQSSLLIQSWPHLHNDYLELLIELGIPAFILSMGIGVKLWIKSVQSLTMLSPDIFPLVWGALIGITSLSFHGVLDFNFAIPGNVLIYFILFGAIYRLSKIHEDGAVVLEKGNQ